MAYDRTRLKSSWLSLSLSLSGGQELAFGSQRDFRHKFVNASEQHQNTKYSGLSSGIAMDSIYRSVRRSNASEKNAAPPRHPGLSRVTNSLLTYLLCVQSSEQVPF